MQIRDLIEDKQSIEMIALLPDYKLDAEIIEKRNDELFLKNLQLVTDYEVYREACQKEAEISTTIINDLRLQNEDLTTDFTTIKKSVFSLLTQFKLISEQGEILKPRQGKLIMQVLGVLKDAFDGEENLFSDIITHVAPLATKYKHL